MGKLCMISRGVCVESGEWVEEVCDARGIYIAKVCDKCREEKLAGYRPEIFSDTGYETDEPVEPEDY